MELAGVYEQQILKLEQRIKNTGATIGNCFASATILFISLSIISAASDPRHSSLNSLHLINLVIAAALVIFVAVFLLGLELMWHKKRLEYKLRILKEVSHETPESVWPPAPQIPR